MVVFMVEMRVTTAYIIRRLARYTILIHFHSRLLYVVLVIMVLGDLPRGNYLAEWRVICGDGLHVCAMNILILFIRRSI